MKKKLSFYFASILCFLWSISLTNVLAQTPDWQVDPAQYSNSMAIVGILIIDRIESVDEQDRVAAFINGECRGIAPLLLDENVNRYMAYLLVYANETQAQISFKIHDASQDVIYEVPYQLSFIVNGLVGEINQPYIWSDIVLNREASITDFSITGQLGATRFEGQNILVDVATGTNLTALIANFTLSQGANVWVDDQRQRSGTTKNNFNQPLVYWVESEDKQTRKSYTVKVQFIDPPNDDVSGIPINAVNAITPNGDGVNDNWVIRNLETFDGYKLSIFDSSGRLLYQTMNYRNEWEGTFQGNPLAEGIYYYLFNKGSDTRKGIISIIK